jgi:hypothetical protein
MEKVTAQLQEGSKILCPRRPVPTIRFSIEGYDHVQVVFLVLCSVRDMENSV